jgi:hypothetical protein
MNQLITPGSTTYVFDGPDGQNSPNYLRRVRTGGGGFVDAVNAPVEILDKDVLLKLDDGPWFALFREQEAAVTDEAPGDKTPDPTEEEEAAKLKTLESGTAGDTTAAES